MTEGGKKTGTVRACRAGFVGFGEVNSPRDLIEKKCAAAAGAVEALGIELAKTAPVSDDPYGRDVRRAVEALKGAEFDFLILCVAGWIPSHAVISVASEFSRLPMLLWGLCGHYRDGVLVTTADQAGTSALRKTLGDLGFRFKYVYDCADCPPRMERIEHFAKAARAVSLLRGAKVGQMGFRDMNLYTTLYDGVSLKAVLGVEVEFFEMLEMVQRAETLQPIDVRLAIERVKLAWTFEKEPAKGLLEKGVAYYLALVRKARERGYGAVSLIDVDGMKKLLGFPPAMVFMLLCEEGIAAIPENDTLGAVTQLVVKGLTGQAAPYMEIYEFMKDRVLFGVPDFVPSSAVEGAVRLLPTKFGLLSEGLLNVSQVKTGRITLCRLTSTGDRYAMHLAAGEAFKPRPWEEAGWAQPAPRLPSLEIALDAPVDDFAQKVLSQHYILAWGDHGDSVRDFCRILRIEIIE
jgi:L-fucose isomerase-like protein